MLHVGAVRQSVKIIEMPQTHLRTGDRAEVTFEFQKRPEWLHVGQKFIFRECLTKAIGTITERIQYVRPNQHRTANPRAKNKWAKELGEKEPSIKT